MTQRSRRVFYGLATVVFLLAGGLILATASGYRWAGFGQGLQRTGAIYISATGRAEVWLNGQDHGSAPQRFTHLAPGVYTIELRQRGLSSWQKTIRIRPQVAEVIGPVTLFPTHFTAQTVATEPWTAILANQARDLMIGGRAIDSSHWLVSDLWPKSSFTTTLPFAPLGLISSPHDQVRLFRGGTDQVAIVSTNNSTPWLVEAVTAVQWDPNSDQVLYGLRDHQVVRLDALAKTIATLATADSFSIFGSDLWFMTHQSTTSPLFHQHLDGQAVAQQSTELQGRWDLVTSPPSAILLQRQPDGMLAQYSPANPLVVTSIGRADQWWWPTTSQPLIWQSGVDVDSRLADGTTNLVDRSPVAYQQISWLDAGNIVLTIDSDQLNIRSVSAKQGRATLMHQTFDQPQQPLVVDPQDKLVITRATNDLTKVTVWSWSTTAPSL